MAKHCPVSCAEDSLTLTSIRSQADCEDAHPRCPVWAKLGDECDNNADMRKYCAKSCATCPMAVSDGESLCRDTNENCRFWADSGECSNVSISFIEVQILLCTVFRKGETHSPCLLLFSYFKNPSVSTLVGFSLNGNS